MTAWTSDELDKIGSAEEQEIASLRRHGTLRNPRTIWVVRLGDDLYVRSVYGRTRPPGSAAPRSATNATSRPVASRRTSPSWRRPTLAINDQIDAAYRTKYRRYAASIISSIVSPEARLATIKLVPGATT